MYNIDTFQLYARISKEIYVLHFEENDLKFLSPIT